MRMCLYALPPCKVRVLCYFEVKLGAAVGHCVKQAGGSISIYKSDTVAFRSVWSVPIWSMLVKLSNDSWNHMGNCKRLHVCISLPPTEWKGYRSQKFNTSPYSNLACGNCETLFVIRGLTMTIVRYYTEGAGGNRKSIIPSQRQSPRQRRYGRPQSFQQLCQGLAYGLSYLKPMFRKRLPSSS